MHALSRSRSHHMHSTCLTPSSPHGRHAASGKQQTPRTRESCSTRAPHIPRRHILPVLCKYIPETASPEHIPSTSSSHAQRILCRVSADDQHSLSTFSRYSQGILRSFSAHSQHILSKFSTHLSTVSHILSGCSAHSQRILVALRMLSKFSLLRTHHIQQIHDTLSAHIQHILSTSSTHSQRIVSNFPTHP